MRFIEFLIEQGEMELIRRDTTVANQLAGEMLRGAHGNAGVAKKMAQSFLQNLLASIDQQDQSSRMKDVSVGQEERRPYATAKGYDQNQPPRTTGFSRYA